MSRRGAAAFVATLTCIVLAAPTLANRPISRIHGTHALLHSKVFMKGSAARHGYRAAASPFALSTTLPTPPPTYSSPGDPTPPVPRPSTSPCIVTLFSSQAFAGDALRTANYTPPAACPGPWAQVVFDWDTSVSDTQYDRTGGVWLGGVEILRETTSEPPGEPISYHTERDVTQYTSLFESPQPFTAEMANYFASGITGIYYVNAQLEFYPLAKGQAAPLEPDEVIPVNAGGSGPSWATLQATSQQVAANVTFPQNTDRVSLEVFASGHISDEFWYANTPDQYVAAGQAGGTAFREIEVSADGVPAGCAWPFPFVYTGGFDPGLWIPIAGINTHDIGPYDVNLTPFAGSFADGASHTIAMNVLNAQSFWLVDGNLLVYEDHGSKQTGGALTSDSLGSSAIETVGVTGYEDIDPPGTVGEETGSEAVGVFQTAASRFGTVSGYVRTSQGLVQTSVAYNYQFTNTFASTGTYSVKQDSKLQTTTTAVTSGAPNAASNGTVVTTEADEYPFSLEYLVGATAVHQGLTTAIGVTTNGASTYTSSLSRTLDAGDVGAAGVSTAPVNHTVYDYSDSLGGCYDRTLQAVAENLVEDQTTCTTAGSLARRRR
jgi:hypothetical protein